jgi:outer membrane receptor protein involved in Fe transport
MTVALSLLAALAAASPQAAAEASAQQGVTVYQPAFFASSGASTALDMVKRIPGFTLDTGASVRGYEGAAGNVLVDGARPASKTDPLDQILYRMPASQVDHIEVIRGGAPGVDMQGKSILANVVRKKTSGFRGLIALASNSVLDDGRQKMGLRVEGSGPAGPGTLEASLRYGEYIDDGSGDGPHVSQDPSGKALQLSNVNSRGDGHQWETNLAYEAPVLGGKLRVNGRGFWDYFSYNEFNWFRLPADTLNRDHDHQDQTQTELGARYSHDLGPRARLELVGLRQTLDYGFVSTFTDPTGPTRFSLDKQTVETIGRAVLKYSYSPSLSLEAGAETAVNTLDSRTGFTQLGVAVALPAANVEVEEDRSELFAKAVWRPSPQWTVESGLRYEMSSISASGDVTIQKDLKYAKPRLSVAWAPRAGTQIRARYEREVGQLNFDDFVASSTLASGVVTTGNPNINPEQAWVSELAIEQAFWGAGSTALTVRHYELTDAADRAPVFDSTGGVFDAPANIGDGTKDELQFDLAVDPGHRPDHQGPPGDLGSQAPGVGGALHPGPSPVERGLGGRRLRRLAQDLLSVRRDLHRQAEDLGGAVRRVQAPVRPGDPRRTRQRHGAGLPPHPRGLCRAAERQAGDQPRRPGHPVRANDLPAHPQVLRLRVSPLPVRGREIRPTALPDARPARPRAPSPSRRS